MAIVQYDKNDFKARMFDGDSRIILSRTNKILTRKEATSTFRELGFKIKTKWRKTDWGWEARFSRRNK